MTIENIKIITAFFVVVGIILGFINEKLAPHGLLLESSPNRPNWLPWVSWGITSLAALLYIFLDFVK